MNTQKLKDCVVIMKKELGDALIAGSIVSLEHADQLVATELSDPFTAILFNGFMERTLQRVHEAGMPPMGRFSIMELQDGVIFFVIAGGPRQYMIAIDTSKVKMGRLLNVIMPKLFDALEDAVTS